LNRIAIVVAAGLCTVLALVGTQGAAAGGGNHHRPHGRRLILAPRPHQRLPARPFLIRLHTGKKARGLRVRLNRDRIAKYFSAPSRRGVRRLRVSASFGLRHGRNRLRVRLRGRRGHWRTRTIHFRIRRNRPLAGAGFDRAIAAGDRVFLNGNRSRSHLHPRSSGRRAGLRLRWKVVKGPRGRVAGGRLAGVHSLRPRVLARRPGRYVLRLTVRAPDGKTGSDLVNVRSDPAPAANFDTMAPGPKGATGIRVGSHFYPAEPGVWVQIVTLDRQTLTPVKGNVADLANKGYPCPGAVSGNRQKCVAALRKDLNRLDDNDLVIASNPLSTSKVKGTPGYGLEGALRRIGVQTTGFDGPAGMVPGAISAVGVPTDNPPQANWHGVFSTKREGGGRMRDYLIRNNAGNHTFASSDRLDFNTQAKGSDDKTNVVTIGDKKFSQDVGDSYGGFQVVVVDAQTLEGQTYWFDLGNAGTSTTANLESMRDVLRQANDAGHKLVVIASRGIPVVATANNIFAQARINFDLQTIADQVERLGGTRNAIFDALDLHLSKRYSYTLVGSSMAGGGHGEEALGKDTPEDYNKSVAVLSVAPMTGTLARTGPNYQFQVQTVPTVGRQSTSGGDPSVAATELNGVVVQPPSAWPEQGNAGRKAAIAWIGRQAFGASDPRTLYWTVIYSANVWNEYSTRIGKLTYRRNAKFRASDLLWAKAELQREIGWLENIHRYLKNLAQPFSKKQLQSWAAFETISNTIRDKVGVSEDQKTTASEQAYWAGFRQILGAIPVIGGAFHAADAIYQTAMRLAEINNQPAQDDFQTKASQLGVQLADRLGAAQDMLTRRIPNTIAADYAKLRTVGSCTSTNPKDWSACRFNHTDWEFTSDDQANAARILVPGVKIWAYGSLLNARYHLYQLPLWWRTTVGDNKEFYGLTIDAIHFPFYGLPPSAKFAKPIYRNIPTYSHTISNYKSSGETWQIYALGYLTGSGKLTDRWLMHYPKAEVTDPIFTSVEQGGLGADPESFYDRYFPQVSTLDHYPEGTTPTGWCAGGIRVAGCD
jgi:hypothetical protein